MPTVREIEPTYVALTGHELIVERRARRMTGAMWRDIKRGTSVFIADTTPNRMTYYYGKARGEGFRIKMRLATVDGRDGIIVERMYEPVPA